MYSLANKRVAIISHVYAPGPPHELEEYLKGRVEELYFVAHPLSFVKQRPSEYRRYQAGKLVVQDKSIIWRLPDLLLYIKDFIANLYLIGRGPKYDLVIALDNLNAASAIWLRTFGRVKKVVFYTIDYIPKRFTNPLLNTLYHKLDDYCVRHADYVWNLSPVMTEMREQKGIEPKYREKQLIVPIGTHILPQGKIRKDPNLLVFMGHLRPGQGVDLLINALPLILKKQPKAKLRLVGSGPLEQELKKQVKELGLVGAVEFTGFVPSNNAMRNMLLEGTIAIAPYVDDETTFTRYTDPGKPKEYLAAGLPVIITRVPKFAETIERRNAGKAIDYDKEELADAVVSLLSSKETQKYQANARRLASEYEWKIVFNQAFAQMR